MFMERVLRYLNSYNLLFIWHDYSIGISVHFEIKKNIQNKSGFDSRIDSVSEEANYCLGSKIINESIQKVINSDEIHTTPNDQLRTHTKMLNEDLKSHCYNTLNKNTDDFKSNNRYSKDLNLLYMITDLN